jgi:tetratricopeptide (TPR) repeat protein
MVSMTRDVPGSLHYYYTNTRNFFLRHAEQIARHPDVRQLAASLLRVVQTGHGLLFLPWHEALESAQRIATRNALDELIEIARRQEDPLTWVRDLPHDWEALYAARGLLQAGIRTEGVLAFATAACAERAQGGSVSAMHERELCLNGIALASGNPGAAVAARFTDPTPSLFGSASEARPHGITAHIDAHPQEIFTHLESAVADIEAVVSLFHWRRLAREWRSLLAAEVFRRMFDRRPIEHDEAVQLVEQIREVIRTLPPSPTRGEYDHVYCAITSWLSGTPVTLTLDPRPESAIRRSHVLAARLLERARTALASGEGAGWIDDFLWERDCWWESTRYKIKDGTISTGVGEDLYLISMLPALRLALAAVGHHLGRPDPAGQFMRDRYDALQRAIAARRKADCNHDAAGREAALQELEGADHTRIRDERVLGASGFVLLLLGKNAEAEERLRRALASPLIDQQYRAEALYNLACVLARTGREEECRTSLEEAVHLWPWFRRGLLQDEDFSSVRGQGWFQSLAPEPPPAATGSAPEPSPAAPVQVPLDFVEPGDLPDRFEGWELRYRIHEPYDRAFPGWALSMAAALTVQFPGATTTVTPVAEYADAVVVCAPQGVPEPQVRRAQEVADLVRAEVTRRAVRGP